MNTLPSTQRRLVDDASTGMRRPPRVSIDNSRFTLIIPGQAPIEMPFDTKGAYIDIIVADINRPNSRLFWGVDENGQPKKFDRTKISPPACWSDNGVAPSSEATEPQSPTCAGCAWNVIGSAIGFKGNAIKACQEFKKLAVVVKGVPGVYLFEVKAGSFKAWNAYVGSIRLQKMPNGGSPDLCNLVTRVRFVGTGLLSFEPVEWVKGQLEATVNAAREQEDALSMIVGRFDKPAQGVLPAPERQAAYDRGMPAQAPLPPPKQADNPPFTLHGADPAGPLFPTQPQGGMGQLKGNAPGLTRNEPDGSPDEPMSPKTRGRPRKVEQPQAQPPQPQQSAGIAAPDEGLPGDIGSRLQALFPKA